MLASLNCMPQKLFFSMFLIHKFIICFRVSYAIIPAVLINIVIHDIQMIRLLIKASLQARMS